MSKESNEMGMFAAIAALKNEASASTKAAKTKEPEKKETENTTVSAVEANMAPTLTSMPAPTTEAPKNSGEVANYTMGVLTKKQKDTRKIRKGFYLSEKAGKNLFIVSEGIGISENELINQLLESLNLS